MKFTKENVKTVIADWFWKDEDSHLDELREKIHELDDTPEEVVVPKFVAEFYESQLGYNIMRMIKVLESGTDREKRVLDWLIENRSKYGLRDSFDLLALIRINGYEVEKQLYAVRGLTDYFRLDNKVILFNDKQEALHIANKIGECCEIEVLDCSSDLNFILISEIRNGL